jgi:hypothetical protein
MGCATAYYLRKADPAIRVAVIEKDPSYRFNSTVLSDGNTRLQVNLPETILISQYGLEVLKTFSEDMAVGDRRPDPAFRQEGNLFTFDPDGMETALAGLALQQEMGCPAATMAELPSGPDLDTNRKRVEAQTSGAPCNTCHTPFINPPGFVLEAFDSTGRAQTAEASTGAAIDTGADVYFSRESDPQPVSNPAELMAGIAASPSAQRFYAQRWVSFAYDRELTPQDICTVDAVAASAVAPDYSIQDLLVDLTQSDYFLTRSHEEVTQ